MLMFFIRVKHEKVDELLQISCYAYTEDEIVHKQSFINRKDLLYVTRLHGPVYLQ